MSVKFAVNLAVDAGGIPSGTSSSMPIEALRLVEKIAERVERIERKLGLIERKLMRRRRLKK